MQDSIFMSQQWLFSTRARFTDSWVGVELFLPSELSLSKHVDDMQAGTKKQEVLRPGVSKHFHSLTMVGSACSV